MNVLWMEIVFVAGYRVQVAGLSWQDMKGRFWTKLIAVHGASYKSSSKGSEHDRRIGLRLRAFAVDSYKILIP